MAKGKMVKRSLKRMKVEGGRLKDKMEYRIAASIFELRTVNKIIQ